MAAAEAQEDAPILRRNPPGTRAADMHAWPPQDLEDMNSVLDLQQYIQQLVRAAPADTDRLLELPEGRDADAWKYEHLRYAMAMAESEHMWRGTAETGVYGEVCDGRMWCGEGS